MTRLNLRELAAMKMFDGSAPLSFTDRIKALSPAVYFPLATNAVDVIGGLTTTVRTGVSFGVDDGIGDGNKCATFASPGASATQAIQIGSAAFVSAVNLNEYTLMTWFKMTADAWTAPAERRMVHVEPDNTALAKIGHVWTGARWDVFRRADGVDNGIGVTTGVSSPDANWHCFFTQCSVSGGFFRMYNGGTLKLNTTSPAPKTWTRSFTAYTKTGIGNDICDGSGANGWIGNIAHVAWFNSILTQPQMAAIASLFT